MEKGRGKTQIDREAPQGREGDREEDTRYVWSAMYPKLLGYEYGVHTHTHLGVGSWVRAHLAYLRGKSKCEPTNNLPPSSPPAACMVHLYCSYCLYSNLVHLLLVVSIRFPNEQQVGSLELIWGPSFHRVLTLIGKNPPKGKRESLVLYFFLFYLYHGCTKSSQKHCWHYLRETCIPLNPPLLRVPHLFITHASLTGQTQILRGLSRSDLQPVVLVCVVLLISSHISSVCSDNVAVGVQW